MKGLAALESADADAGAVAEAIVRVVDAPFGKRLFRVHIDPSQDEPKSSMVLRTACAPNCCGGSA
jgi:hypothetical protein